MTLSQDTSAPVIGVDFDNTLVSYDEVIHSLALELGLIQSETPRRKKAIRDTVRMLPGGEMAWQRLQALVYGPHMDEATLIDGVSDFFQACIAHGVKTYIVSHKTEYASTDKSRFSLRQAAMKWMTSHHFFDPEGFGLSTSDVFFESTRQRKLVRIAWLGCTDFIDDLEEVFLEKGFPPGVRKILYAPHLTATELPGVETVSSWQEVTEAVFDAKNRVISL